jgi:methylmalonyl-CoA mutase, C-terminal domain
MYNMESAFRGRVLIAKVGLDGHEASAKLISMMLSEAGYEVIYTGPRQTPENIVSTAVQEDVTLIGISILSGAHMYAASETLRLLRERHLSVPLILGGIIPRGDHERLLALGVAAVLGPGSSSVTILSTVDALVKPQLNRKSGQPHSQA